MNKEEVLREIYEIIEEITVFSLKPFPKFLAENQNKPEAELMKMLRVAKQFKSKANK